MAQQFGCRRPLLTISCIARDIQGFEMSPLGPFNGKSFGTTISPWIITQEALKPFVTKANPRADRVPGYLVDPENVTYSINMQVEILDTSLSPTVIGTSQVSSLYWTVRQMIAHATCSGSPLRTGDILATGTVSEPGNNHRGCLLEATEGGIAPLRLADGSKRGYLHDGDSVRMTAIAGDAASGVGFGECIAALRPSTPL